MKFPKLKTPLVLAPMAGITDIAFRALCRKYGASLTVSEMVSAQAILRGNERTNHLLKRAKNEKPYAIQLFGKDPETMLNAAKLIEKKCDIIDINLGCPAAKITKQGYGSSLLSNSVLIKKIITTITKNVKKPVTVKIRSGIDDKHINAVKIAKIAEKAGAAAITVHARTQAQGYSGKADWNIIAKVKKAVSIPVIGNGDIVSGKTAKEMKEKADYIMVGRAARGHPEIFQEILDFLGNNKKAKGAKSSSPKKIISASKKEIEKLKEMTTTTKKIDTNLEAFKQYLTLAEKHNISFPTIKNQAAYFTKGMKGGAELRKKISKTKNLKELKKSIL